jgi:hypothetical protein
MDVSRRAAKWAAAVLAVSLVLPAATKQWSDNQQQRQLKTEVTSALAAAVSEATTNGGFLLADGIQQKRSDEELRAAFQDTMVAWKSEAAAIDGQIVGYFAKTSPDKDALVIAMRAYDRVVQNYLGYCWLYQNQESAADYVGRVKKQVDKMRRQTEGQDFAVVPEPLESYVSGADWPPKDMNDFREVAQNEWAQNIVNASAPINAMIYERQPNGLEVGAGAFIRQIIPFN